MSSSANLIVIAFLILVIVWLFGGGAKHATAFFRPLRVSFMYGDGSDFLDFRLV